MKVYVSVGSPSKSDGVTMFEAEFSDEGKLLSGEHSPLSKSKLELDEIMTPEEYAGSFYLGKLVTEEEYTAYLAAPKQGHVGMVNEEGLAAYQADIELHKERTLLNCVIGCIGAFEEAKDIAELMVYDDVKFKRALMVRKVPEAAASYIMLHKDEAGWVDSANSRLAQIETGELYQR